MGHRKTRRIYDEPLTYEKMYAAWKTVSHTCKNRRGVFEFAMFSEARVAKLLDIMKERKYWPDRYRCFMIFEPKPRLVMSQSIKDKVINHFVANEYLIPILEPSLLDANVATRKKKGSSYAMKLLKKYFAQMQAERPGEIIYALKVDVSKFFYRIDHGLLTEMLERKIKDKNVIEILRRIINETNKPYVNKVIDKLNRKYGTDIPHYEKGKGLSIGAVTSQFLAIFYLSKVDRKIKEVYKQRFFIRYMDDFLILGWSKAELMALKREIEQDLAGMKLRVNPKSGVYNCCSQAGVPFLGYRYYVVDGQLKIACLNKTVRRVRARLRMLSVKDPEKYERSKVAYGGYFMQVG